MDIPMRIECSKEETLLEQIVPFEGSFEEANLLMLETFIQVELNRYSLAELLVRAYDLGSSIGYSEGYNDGVEENVESREYTGTDN